MPAIGSTVPRIDAVAKVTGEARFSTDMSYPDQLWMKILFAGRPHARIRAIDTTAAEATTGVVAVFTASDVPVNEYGYVTKDQPVLCGLGSSIPGADRVRFTGDQVALVVAETENIATEACRKIVVDYQDLPVVTDVHEAMKPDAPRLHERYPGNDFRYHKIRRGDVEAAFTAADVIVESQFRTPVQEHAYLEPEAGVSYIDEDGRVTVVVAGQWAYWDRAQIAHSLGLPEEQVRVIYPYIGGAFGGREDVSIQIVLALAAWRLGQRGVRRPVKTAWSREESVSGHGKRHPFHVHTRWAATRDGRVTAAEIEMILDCGAYEYSSDLVAELSMQNCTGPYDIPNVKVDTHVVYTNSVPRCAFRGYGGPQGAFVSEMQMNKLADALGMDPVDLRMRNLVFEGSTQAVNTPWPPGVSIRKVAAECARASGWEQSAGGWKRPSGTSRDVPGQPHLKRGLAFVNGFQSVGFSHGFPDTCAVAIELHGQAEIEQVILHHTAPEVGQGSHTVMTQMAAEALGVPLEKVTLERVDSGDSPDAGAASASRITYMTGNAILGAARMALEKWQAEERPVKVEYKYHADPTTEPDHETGECVPVFSYGYMACAAEVEVDTETGVVRLARLMYANDVGKAINPQQVEAQMEGALVQAAGYALMENLVEEGGYIKTPNFSTYLIPTVMDVPGRIDKLVLEYGNPRGPWGATGIGEIAFQAVAPVTLAAVHAATGTWFDEFPLTPERVLFGLADKGRV
jgi:CO/xanthine dehydrogenase Mo-binding subunit